MGSWGLGELLVNYEAGFVRRGILGQLVFLTQNPVHSANLIQNLVIILFLIGSVYIFFKEETLRSKILYFIVLVFAPGALLDMAASGMEFLDRKEIWFYCSLIMIIATSNRIGFYNIKTVVITTTLSVLMILHHELYAVFIVPSLLYIYLLNKDKIYLNVFTFIIPTSLTFLIVFYYSGNASIAKGIADSYTLTHEINIGGGVTSIGWDFQRSFYLTKKMYNDGSLYYWIFHALLSMCLVLLYQFTKFKEFKEFKSLQASTIISSFMILATLIAMISGWDWGRWISMYGILSIFIFNLLSTSLGSIKNINHFILFNEPQSFSKKFSRTHFITAFFLILLIFLSTNTQIMHCCPKKPVVEFQVPNL
jgi:hypothetical protein